jgi:hypothetical protein
MHPQLEHLAHQAHVDDLRREAEQHRRTARLLRRRARAEAKAAVPVLSPAVHDVLVFAEREPTQGQVAQVLEQLKGLQGDVVTALIHHRPRSPEALVNESGTHSLSLPTPAARIPAQRAPSEAQQHLSDVIGAFRAAGHDTRGELVEGSVPRLLAQQVRERSPEAVILLTSRHRLAHLARRDLEHRLRRQTSVPVVAVSDRRPRHQV